MLDFSHLRTPPLDGDVLIEPSAAALAGLAESNHVLLRSYRFDILDIDVQSVRMETRAALCAGCDQPTVITGHQPDFIHAGVWAKHVVAGDLARKLGGKALNLVVDSDAPNRNVLEVPVILEARTEVKALRYADSAQGVSHEGVPRISSTRLDSFVEAVRSALGSRFQASCLPTYFAAMAADEDDTSWVDQMIRARQAVEREFGVEMLEHRTSRVWYGPLLADLLLSATRFRDCYNSALLEYRRDNRVRNRARPIPDLSLDGTRCELPVWVYRIGQPRSRLFAERSADRVTLYADRLLVGDVPVDRLSSWSSADEALRNMDGYLFRPRALSLTLWARVCVGDLFIHGIGGAKYDRITDGIIRRYFNVEPPQMACVSATLLMKLPGEGVESAAVGRARHRIRDIRYNPQRHVRHTPETETLAASRRQAVSRSMGLAGVAHGDRRSRRTLFDQIRSLNAAILDRDPSVMTEAEAELVAATRRMTDGRVASRRDYFFAMHDQGRLKSLREKLAAMVDDRV